MVVFANELVPGDYVYEATFDDYEELSLVVSRKDCECWSDREGELSLVNRCEVTVFSPRGMKKLLVRPHHVFYVQCRGK